MSAHPAPRIGVNGLRLLEPRPGLRLDDRYASAVLAAGGVPLVLPPVGGPRDIERYLDALDGLLLTGGDDFTTEPLGLGATHPRAVRTPLEKQEFDLHLTRRALARGMPVLGICYGMQLLGIAGGADLLQHLPEDRPGCPDHAGGVEHEVTLASGSKLARLLAVERLTVVSRHHQALDAVGAPWRVSASAEHAIVEAIEHPELPFALGVQWHPELSPPGSPHDRLFHGLVAAAGMASALPSPCEPSTATR